MKLLPILFFIVSVFLTDTDSILYGRFISTKDAPYFVAILDSIQNVTFCGGSIISEDWVLTAAHCLGYNSIGIIAGESLKNKGHQIQNSSIYQVEKTFVHGNYYDGTYDLALVKLKKPIRFDEYQQPIKIRKNPPIENEIVTLIGLGGQGDARGKSVVLRQTEVTVTNKTICDSFATLYIASTDTIFCAGNGTTDVCAGDSGGPAVIDGQLAGLVSMGPRCTSYDIHLKIPGVYTRLNIFHDWISNITGIVF